MALKNCIVCNKEFEVRTSSKTCSNECKVIRVVSRNHENYVLNKEERYEKRKENLKQFRLNNPNYVNNYMREYRKKDTNKEYNRNRSKTDRFKFQRNKRSRERYREDIGYRIMTLMRKQMLKYIKNDNKKYDTIEYLGCNVNEWKIYLENMFDENMSWDNHGSYWDIDHIKPLSVFDFTNEDEIKVAFHYTNTQPLESFYNRHIKKNKWFN